ncbi:hypothetical protein GCM10025858_34830 [Alicyclobacillus sacchari]|uniref:hypothetical protein n=1 Tax=Alicyclobacillus sacchari TaxID=392010 RepID=UPI0023E92756|nr:hypothetical protein [Alicyclobacillus sacchari]GMA58980.1 hypothetical protein GCM10025858_34830 [Alicyclobacillus sacchari]
MTYEPTSVAAIESIAASHTKVSPLWLLRFTCYALAVVAVAFAIVGLCPVGWRAGALVVSLFTNTIGLALGLTLYVLKERTAMKVLGLLVGTFAFAYLCCLLHPWL